MNIVSKLCICLCVVSLACVATLPVWAQGEGGNDATTPDTDAVLEQMLKKANEQPTIAPNRTDRIEAGSAGAPVNQDAVAADPRVVGTAPGGAARRPTLLREGEFLINRRGRVKRAPDGTQMLFIFDADSKDSPEAPMVLMPCRELQTMEDVVADRGDRVVFLLTGQVFVYRGANYLLPTKWTLQFDRGNLEN